MSSLEMEIFFRTLLKTTNDVSSDTSENNNSIGQATASFIASPLVKKFVPIYLNNI